MRQELTLSELVVSSSLTRSLGFPTAWPLCRQRRKLNTHFQHNMGKLTYHIYIIIRIFFKCKLKGSAVFSKLDLRSAFHQLKLAPRMSLYNCFSNRHSYKTIQEIIVRCKFCARRIAARTQSVNS